MILFTDYRHIRCGDVSWSRPDGTELPLTNPPAPMISNAVACLGWVPRGIRLVAQRATLEVPAKTGGCTVLYDQELRRYRAWSLEPEGRNLTVIYRESTNATDWTEKGRGVVTVTSQYKYGPDGMVFFIDPKGPPSERYKAVYSAQSTVDTDPELWGKFLASHPRGRDTRLSEKSVWYMFGLVSADGVAWKPLERPLMVHMSDTFTTVYYDSWLDKYVMYTRLYWLERRMVGRTESADFRHWEPLEPVIWPKLDYALSDDIYVNCRTDYPGAIGQAERDYESGRMTKFAGCRMTKPSGNLPLPGYHLMFPMVYHRLDQTSDVHMYSSVDGIFWNEVPGGPVVVHGMKGHEKSVFIHVEGNLIPLPGDRVGLQYFGNTFPHKYPRWPEIWKESKTGWAWWPRGRLVAVKADTEGEFYTFPLDVRGDTLCANYRTAKNGEVRFGLVGVEDCSVNDCVPLRGDQLSTPLCWKGNPGFQGRQTVELHVKMKNAELFSLEWKKAPAPQR